MEAVVSVLRSIGRRIAAIARWSFESSEEEPRATPPPRPGPPHGPVPAIDLRRDPHRGQVPPRGGVPPSS